MREARFVILALVLTSLGAGGIALGKQLTLQSMNEGVSFNSVKFSPDGKLLLFVSNKSGKNKIWAMGVDGSNAHVIVNDDGAESSPCWSPNGRWIAFLRTEAGQGDIWVVDPAGKNLRKLTNDKEDERAIVWSPDSTRVAFISARAGFQDIYVVEVGTRKVEQLTEKTNAWDEVRWEPNWSPDGSWIAYVSNRSDYFADDLWLVEVATKKTRRLTVDLRALSAPVWSPDGKHIALHAVKNSEFWYGDMSDLYVVEMPERTVRKVEMNTLAGERHGVAWSPDSRFLYFGYQWQGDANLWAVPVEGGVATQMTYEQGVFNGFSVGPDGRFIIYVRSTPVSAGEIYRLDVQGGAPQQLTRWVEAFDGVRAPERISFRSTDGKYMQAYLYLPPDFDAGKKYPCLVQAHGGGTNAYGNGFHDLEQFMAQNGFVVMAIEFRGGSGQGRDFQKLALGEWSSGQGWDGVAAARYLLGLPFCNGKVGMYGGSYGAIMTMAAVTRDSGPFSAAAPFYGRYDWEEAFPFGDRVAQFWTIQGHLGFKPGENPDIYEHTATIRHLEKVKTDLPFLITHGEKDRRCPFKPALRLIEELKKRGNPVDFYSYPEEAHGFRLAKNRIHAYGMLLQFFKKHLQ